MKPILFEDEHGNPHWKLAEEPVSETPPDSIPPTIANLTGAQAHAVAFLMNEARTLAKTEIVSGKDSLLLTPQEVFRTQLDAALRKAKTEGLYEVLPEIIQYAALLYGEIKEREEAKVPSPVVPVRFPSPVANINRRFHDLQAGRNVKQDIEELKRSISEPLKKAAENFAVKVGPANGDAK